MRYFRPTEEENEKKRTEISMLLIESGIQKYVQL